MMCSHVNNYRVNEIHAALGRVQLGKLDRNNRQRNVLTAVYRPRWITCRTVLFPLPATRAIRRVT